LSRIKSDKINITSSIVVDYSNQTQDTLGTVTVSQAELEEKFLEANSVIEKAQIEAQKIIEQAKAKALEIEQNASQTVAQAQIDAQKLIDEAQVNAQNIISEAQSEIETLKETTSQEGAKQGYEAGYADGLLKFKEELADKIEKAETLAKVSFEIRDKIINSAQNEIVEMLCLIAKKLSLKLVDKEAVFEIVQKCISLLENKDEITLLLGKEYADMLNEYFSCNPEQEIKNLKIAYSEKISSDTIIVESPKERLDAGFASQLDVILDQFRSQLLLMDKTDLGEE